MFVYFIGAIGGMIKIGASAEPEKRLKALQVGSGVKLQLLAVASGGRRHEQELHDRFREWRQSGEWFEPAPDLLALIWHIANGGKLELPEQSRERAIDEWLAACTAADPDGRATTSALYASYSDWCAVHKIDGETVLTPVAFGRELTSRCYARRKGGDGRVIRLGLRLLGTPDVAQTVSDSSSQLSAFYERRKLKGDEGGMNQSDEATPAGP